MRILINCVRQTSSITVKQTKPRERERDLILGATLTIVQFNESLSNSAGLISVATFPSGGYKNPPFIISLLLLRDSELPSHYSGVSVVAAGYKEWKICEN